MLFHRLYRLHKQREHATLEVIITEVQEGLRMGFISRQELQTFDFSQSVVLDMKQKPDAFQITVSDVIISAGNSQNQELRSMGTNEMKITLEQVSEFYFLLDGYTLYNMDDTIAEKTEDTALPKEEYEPLFSSLKEAPIEQIEQRDGYYFIYLDTDEQKVSYTIKIKAERDRTEWERFRNLPSEYWN